VHSDGVLDNIVLCVCASNDRLMIWMHKLDKACNHFLILSTRDSLTLGM